MVVNSTVSLGMKTTGGNFTSIFLIIAYFFVAGNILTYSVKFKNGKNFHFLEVYFLNRCCLYFYNSTKYAVIEIVT